MSRAISIYEGTGIAEGVDYAIDTEFCGIPGRKNVSEVALVNIKTNNLVNAAFNKKRGMIVSVESGHQASKLGGEKPEGQDEVRTEHNYTKQIPILLLIMTSMQVQ